MRRKSRPRQSSLLGNKKKSELIEDAAAKKKNDLQVLAEYVSKYVSSMRLHEERMSSLDANTFNTCCCNLNNSVNVVNISIYDEDTFLHLKVVISFYVRSPLHLIYTYSNCQNDLIDYVLLRHKEISQSQMYNLIDKAYMEVFKNLLHNNNNLFI